MVVVPNVYVGPYLLASVKTSNNTVDKCRSPEKCPNTNSAFCPECGLDLARRFEMVRRSDLDINEVAQANGFYVVDSDYGSVPMSAPSKSRYILLPNEKGFYENYKRTLQIDRVYGFTQESWRYIDPRTEVHDFGNLYIENMLALQSAGCEDLVIDWGLVHWCM